MLQDRLAKRFAVLTRGQRDSDERQATLWGAINWSWALLREPEQAGLAQLSVFRGGFSLDAAEAVLDLSRWPTTDKIELFASLLDKSLLRSSTALGNTRLDMYVSVRAFARKKLEESIAFEAGCPDRDALRATQRRHALYYAEHKPGGIESCSLELDNYLGAIETSIAQGDTDVLRPCAFQARRVFECRGPLMEGVVMTGRTWWCSTPAVAGTPPA